MEGIIASYSRLESVFIIVRSFKSHAVLELAVVPEASSNASVEGRSGDIHRRLNRPVFHQLLQYQMPGIMRAGFVCGFGMVGIVSS